MEHELRLTEREAREFTNGEMSVVRITFEEPQPGQSPSPKYSLNMADYEISNQQLGINLIYWVDLKDYIGDPNVVVYNRRNIGWFLKERLDGLDLYDYPVEEFHKHVPDHLKRRFKKWKREYEKKSEFAMMLDRKIIINYENGQASIVTNSSQLQSSLDHPQYEEPNAAYDRAKEREDVNFREGNSIIVDIKFSE